MPTNTQGKHTAGYFAMKDGRVFSALPWRGTVYREMRQHPNSHGYMRVRLTIGGKRVARLVHKLMADKYLPPRPSPAHEIRHLDGDRTNNRADNLQWGTRKDNADDRERHGRTSRGPKHSAAIKVGLGARHG